MAGEVSASSVKFTCGMLQKRVWREGAEGEEGQGRRRGAWVTVSCDADEDDFTALWNVGAVAEDFEIDDDVLLLMARDEFAKSAAEGEHGLASCWASRQYARVKRVDRGGAGFVGEDGEEEEAAGVRACGEERVVLEACKEEGRRTRALEAKCIW